MATDQDCPCGSGSALADCCGPIISGARAADTAEILMRSRYSAYVLGDVAYLRTSWHPATRPAIIELDDSANWLGLKIIATREGGRGDDQGNVEFVARYKVAGRAYRLHEISRFQRVAGRWAYFSGEPGRSDSRAKAGGN